MDTIYLQPDVWDLTLDASGNIALASQPYSLAQDAATAIRTFAGECYYDTTQGLPYFDEIFTSPVPLSLYRALCVKAALSVPGVIRADVFFTDIGGRQLRGQVQCYDSGGNLTLAGF